MKPPAKSPIPDQVQTEVVVAKVLSPGTALVRLPNDREVFGYCRSSSKLLGHLEAGAKLSARMFLADFSRAELLGVV